MPKLLSTTRLDLLACTTSIYRAVLAGEKKLSAALGVQIAPQWSHFGLDPFRYAYRRVQEHPAEANWWTYLILHRQDQMLIGSCGYKGPPARRGSVEIGYEIAQTYQNQGLATETARALIDFAFQFPEVKKVKAHTLAYENASVQVLKKCGMQFVHTLYDPDEGDVWLWEIDAVIL